MCHRLYVSFDVTHIVCHVFFSSPKKGTLRASRVHERVSGQDSPSPCNALQRPSDNLFALAGITESTIVEMMQAIFLAWPMAKFRSSQKVFDFKFVFRADRAHFSMILPDLVIIVDIKFTRNNWNILETSAILTYSYV